MGFTFRMVGFPRWIGRSTTQGHTEALKEEKMPGILDRVVARAAPRR